MLSDKGKILATPCHVSTVSPKPPNHPLLFLAECSFGIYFTYFKGGLKPSNIKYKTLCLA